jgi:cell division initiation protein
MPVTPLDLRKKTFTKVNFRGIDPKEVKDFLETVARDMESLNKERTLLAEKVDELNAKLEGFTRTEKAFQEAFVTAQQACKDLKANAEREGTTIIAQARLEGEKLIRQAEEQSGRIAQEIADIRARKLAMVGELRGMVESLSKLVEHWETQEGKFQPGKPTSK